MFERIKLDRRRVIISFSKWPVAIQTGYPHVYPIFSHAELDNHLSWIQIRISYTIKNADWNELSTLKFLKLVWTEWNELVTTKNHQIGWTSRCEKKSLSSWLTIVCSIMSKFAMAIRAIRHEWKVLQSNSLPSPRLNSRWAVKKNPILTLCTHKGLSRILSLYFRGHNAGFRETAATTTSFADLSRWKGKSCNRGHDSWPAETFS